MSGPATALERRALAVASDEYPAFFAGLANQAHRSIAGAYYLASVFPEGDLLRSHRQTMQSMVRAAGRGVRVSLVLGWPSRDTSRRRNVLTARFLMRRNIAVRIASGIPFHYKFCVFDDAHALIGSHNLTVGALVNNVEMSVAVRDAAACGELGKLHKRLWDASAAVPEGKFAARGRA